MSNSRKFNRYIAVLTYPILSIRSYTVVGPNSGTQIAEN